MYKSNSSPYPMSLGLTVNYHKNGILLAYIANKIPNIHLRKLLKIIYLLDEHFMLMRGFPLTWFDYYAWEKGPVAPEVYAVKDGSFHDFVSVGRNGDGKRVVNSVEPNEFRIYKQMDEFSRSEVDEIDRLLEEYKNRTADELSDITHVPESLWSKVVKQNNITFEKNGGKSECRIALTLLFDKGDRRLDIFDDAQWNMEFQAMLNAKRNRRNVPTA